MTNVKNNEFELYVQLMNKIKVQDDFKDKVIRKMTESKSAKQQSQGKKTRKKTIQTSW